MSPSTQITEMKYHDPKSVIIAKNPEITDQMSFSTGRSVYYFTAPVNNNFMKVDQKEQNQKKTENAYTHKDR